MGGAELQGARAQFTAMLPLAQAQGEGLDLILSLSKDEERDVSRRHAPDG